HRYGDHQDPAAGIAVLREQWPCGQERNRSGQAGGFLRAIFWFGLTICAPRFSRRTECSWRITRVRSAVPSTAQGKIPSAGRVLHPAPAARRGSPRRDRGPATSAEEPV